MTNLTIYIIGVVITCFLFWFLLMITDSWRLRRLRKKYNEFKTIDKENRDDRGGEAGDRGGYTGGKGFENADPFTAGQNKSTGDRILPAAKTNPVRTNSHSFRVSSNFKY